MDLLLKKSDKRADRRIQLSRREHAQQMKISQRQMERLVETSESALQLAAWAAILQVQPPGSQLHSQALAGLQGMTVARGPSHALQESSAPIFVKSSENARSGETACSSDNHSSTDSDDDESDSN